MKEEIEDLIKRLQEGGYDQEIVHTEYDDLLEKFILNYDESLLGLMKVLISLEKEFWYA